MNRIALIATLALWTACGTPSKPPQSKNTATRPTARPAKVGTLDDLGKALVRAIGNNDEAAAFKLLPTRAELVQLGYMKFAIEGGYAKFLAKRRRGFARVVAKYKRKYPAGCKRLEFARIIKGAQKTIRKITTIKSINLFARCDGREIWLADPDMLLRFAAGWKLLEFS